MPYGLAYLPTYIAVDRGLIQKHAAAAGLGAVKVTAAGRVKRGAAAARAQTIPVRRHHHGILFP